MTVERIRCGGLLALALLTGLVLALPARAALFTFSVDSTVTFNDFFGGSVQLLAFSREFTGTEPGVTTPSPNTYVFPGLDLNADGVSYTSPSALPSSGPPAFGAGTLSVSLSASHNGETVSQSVAFEFVTQYLFPVPVTYRVFSSAGVPDFVFSDGLTRLRINHLFSSPDGPLTLGATDTSDLQTLDMLFIVPEPATLTVLGAALAGLAAVRRRRRPAA